MIGLEWKHGDVWSGQILIGRGLNPNVWMNDFEVFVTGFEGS
ncbi:hypothetical protein NBRC111894_4649 [Sporolactobacillus inulinus]|uniref:Uncharacterized protein n=1 Tax=Sporolactobacillus inulinus TaxID=2078 RepID=A0A4Y1ZJ12_9BACL|nr:hypothetical protein NBRC111894_4649 [Sporolactobacillus inulinus]